MVNLAALRTLLSAVGPGLTTVSTRMPHLSRDGEAALLATGVRQLQTPSLRDAVQALSPWAPTLRSLSYTVDGHASVWQTPSQTVGSPN